MANYQATTRSNYFRVKDAKAFEQWCRKRSLEFWNERRAENPEDVFYAITDPSGENCGWPNYDSATDQYFDFPAELTDHLNPEDVAVLLEIGSEKLRYLVGTAIAVHPDGRTIAVSLDEIYERARHAFGPKVTITEGGY